MTDVTTTILPPLRRVGTTIKGLSPNLPERGKIKIGIKGETRKSAKGIDFQPPKKLDHFIITTLDRGTDGNFKMDAGVHQRLGPVPTAIPIWLLFDDPALNFPTRYACYTGRTLWCTGDGETASRISEDKKSHIGVECPCPRKEPTYQGSDRCKMNGVLSCMVEGAGGIGGVWKFRTTSYNSIVGILSSMSFLRSITGGPLAGIPLMLTIRPKQVTDPIEGKQQTVYVVGVEFDGDMSELRQLGKQIALDRATTHLYIDTIEHQARLALEAAPTTMVPLPGDTLDDVIDEFYPEQAAETPADAPPRPQREDFEPQKTAPDASTEAAPAAAPEPEPEPAPAPVHAFTLIMPDGEILPYDDIADFRAAYMKHLAESFKNYGLSGGDGFYETNRPEFIKWAHNNKDKAAEMERFYAALRDKETGKPQEPPKPPVAGGRLF